jgi:hypothetical protein
MVAKNHVDFKEVNPPLWEEFTSLWEEFTSFTGGIYLFYGVLYSILLTINIF